MRCPRCLSALVPELIGAPKSQKDGGPYRAPSMELSDEEKHSRQELDRCSACGGVWFDKGEITAALYELVQDDELATVSTRGLASKPQILKIPSPLHCPRCGILMQAIQSRAAPEVVFDQCPRCRGVWFDRDELRVFALPVVSALALKLKEFD